MSNCQQVNCTSVAASRQSPAVSRARSWRRSAETPLRRTCNRFCAVVALSFYPTLLCTTVLAGPVFPAGKPEWSVEFKGGVIGHPALFGPVEKNRGVLITEHDGRVSLLNPAGQTQLSMTLDLPVETPAVAVDLSREGNLSVIAVDAWGSIYCFNETGERLWKFPLAEKSGEFRLPVFADLDGDGKLEIFISDSRGHLRVLDARGRLRMVVKATDYRLSVPAVGDVTGDGKPEIIFGTEAGEVYCLGHGGDLLWTTTLDGCFGRAFPLIADADNDGSYEVYWPTAFTNPKPGLFALDAATGQKLWKAPSVLQTYRSTVVADFDGDGKSELLFGDKNSSLFCLDAAGKQRWTTQLPGRGIFFAPALAALDGAGASTSFVAVRGSGHTGHSLYALDSTGAVKDQLALPGGGGCSPTLCRFEGHAEIALLIASASGQVQCFQLEQKPGSKIHWPGVRNDFVNTGYVKSSAQPVKRTAPLAATPMPRRKSLRVHGGTNRLPMANLPDDAELLEIKTIQPDQAVRVELVRKAETGRTPQASFAATSPGQYVATVRAFSSQVTAESFSGRLDRDCRSDEERLHATLRELGTLGRERPSRADLSGALVAQVRSALEQAKRTRAAADFDAFQTKCGYVVGLCRSLHEWRLSGAILLHQIMNPWEQFDAAEFFRTPNASPNSIALNMLGNEYESVAVALSNLRGRPATLRLACGPFQCGDRRVNAREVLTLHEVISVRPDGTGDFIEDALPRLGEGQTIRLEAGETRKVWLTFRSKSLAAGNWRATLKLGEPGALEAPQEIPVSVEISPVRLPDRFTYRECNWLYLHGIADEAVREATMRDALEHGMNVFVIPGVSIQVDEHGKLGPANTDLHDKLVRALGSNIFFLVSGPVSVHWPAAAKPDVALQEKAFADSLRWYGEHMKSLGCGYDSFAIYLQDEPGLMGRDAGFDAYVEQVKRFKAAEPRIQLYANPAGGARAELLRPLQDLIDVWQPDLHLVREQPEALGEIFRRGKHYWHYEAPGDQRYLDPLGFYRVKPWVAFQMGMTGGGYWVYSSADYWFAEPGGGSEYGSVYPTDKDPVTTKRWEASRDGIEDFELLNLVRNSAGRADGPLRQEASKLVAEAVRFVTHGQENVTDISRHVRPYTPDFSRWMDLRRQLIAMQLRLAK